ncbi:putative spoIIIJ-associated protein Jag [Mycobacterium avium subsp. avium 2285 (R)]|nr:putative spoIIIJ-associated protein Jag [Mycobacterium avium subsp. avium 2285 (R)]
MADADTTERELDTAAPAEPEPADGDEADDLEERLVAEGEIAGDYLEELLDLLDFDGDIDLDVEGSRAVVSIDGSDDLNKLVGARRRGSRCAAGAHPARRAPEDRSAEPADARHRELAPAAPGGTCGAGRQGGAAGARIGATRRARADDPVRAQDRARRGRGGAGVHSESEGVEPSRRVVVLHD